MQVSSALDCSTYDGNEADCHGCTSSGECVWDGAGNRCVADPMSENCNPIGITACEDLESWFHKKAVKDCAWVEENPERRCGKGDAVFACRLACTTCEACDAEDHQRWAWWCRSG